MVREDCLRHSGIRSDSYLNTDLFWRSRAPLHHSKIAGGPELTPASRRFISVKYPRRLARENPVATNDLERAVVPNRLQGRVCWATTAADQNLTSGGFRATCAFSSEPIAKLSLALDRQ